MPIPPPSSDNYGSPSDAGIMGEDYRQDQLRFKEAPAKKKETPKRSKPYMDDTPEPEGAPE